MDERRSLGTCALNDHVSLSPCGCGVIVREVSQYDRALTYYLEVRVRVLAPRCTEHRSTVILSGKTQIQDSAAREHK